ncbi:MAG TPA: guanylate kinase [Actinomycetota bacterium]
MISGPSGVGKGTVVRRLLERDPSLYFSVSAKTRAPRPGEVDGVHYWFIPEDRFDRLIELDQLLEWAETFGHRSGTLAEPVERARDGGRDVILEIDVQGAAQIRTRVPDAVLVFLSPPSREELTRRLVARGTERGADLERRLSETDHEMAQSRLFDHEVVNDVVDRAVDEVVAILERYGHRPSPAPMPSVSDFAGEPDGAGPA